MATNNNFDDSVQALFKGMESFMTTKTVVGDAIHINDTIILPLVDITFGCGAGATNKETKGDSAGGGLGGKISPSAVLVIQDGNTKLVSLRNTNNVTKLMDMVPEMVSKFIFKDDKKQDSTVDMSDEEVKQAVNETQDKQEENK